MKKRPNGFLSEEQIDQDSEIFDYIRELGEYLWEFVWCVLPSANGNLHDYVDIALRELIYKTRNKSRRGINY